MKKTINIIVALSWTLMFILCIFEYHNNIQPSWWAVFSPLVCIMLDSWIDVLDERL